MFALSESQLSVREIIIWKAGKCVTHSKRAKIVIDVLPITLRRRVDLVHDADVRVTFERIVPVPSRTVSISVSEGA